MILCQESLMPWDGVVFLLLLRQRGSLNTETMRKQGHEMTTLSNKILCGNSKLLARGFGAARSRGIWPEPSLWPESGSIFNLSSIINANCVKCTVHNLF